MEAPIGALLDHIEVALEQAIRYMVDSPSVAADALELGVEGYLLGFATEFGEDDVQAVLRNDSRWVERASRIASRLNERAASVPDAATRGLALHVFDDYDDKRTYCLYDPQAFIKQAASSKPVDALKGSIVGMLSTHHPKVGEAWGAKEVSNSAAEKGYGPLLYDIAMAAEGGLIPDRYSTTGQAKKVWRTYKDARPDVEHRPLDDVDNPSTPDTQDDAKVKGDDLLDQAYFIKGGPSPDALESNDADALEQLRQLLWDDDLTEVDAPYLKRLFGDATQAYFSGKYW